MLSYLRNKLGLLGQQNPSNRQFQHINMFEEGKKVSILGECKVFSNLGKERPGLAGPSYM